jgi:hypothetical protein
VVGLLVGLGVALAVAVYVTRVPVPFVDRGVSRKPAQDVDRSRTQQGLEPQPARRRALPIRWAIWRNSRLGQAPARPRRHRRQKHRLPAPIPFTYFVQAGAFRTPEDAEAQRAKLAMLGIAAAISEREQSWPHGLPRARRAVQPEGAGRRSRSEQLSSQWR